LPRLIAIKEAQQLDNPIYIDLRSPSEYEIGRVPGAVNIPLFTDEERSEVGTLYRQCGPELAKDRGLAIVSPRLHAMVNAIQTYASCKRPVIVYCWRGGMRSGSVATVLELMGITVYRLSGGYKAYRQYVLEQLSQFSLRPQIVVLCGSTGVGKTTLLQMLSKADEAVIDLEGLANHRGSAFGHVGLGKPSTAQNFDAMLLQELFRANVSPTLLVECESKRIGNVYLPEFLYQAMQHGKRILVSASLETRVERLIQEYLQVGAGSDQAIIASIQSLTKRLGAKHTQHLIEYYQLGRINEVVETLLIEYYDPLYGYEQPDSASYDFCVNADDLEQAASEIQRYIVSLGR
jgi:tRNA 2-selenouridine synthase